VSGDPTLEEGWVDHVVAAEFPELRLRWMEVDGPPMGRKSPPELQERLEALSSRFYGSKAIAMRRDPIPHAYRVFFRAIGLDPDTTRTPVEEAAMERLFDGHFRSRGHLLDALRIPLVETGIPLWALDTAGIDGPLGVRTARAGERLGTGPYANDLEPGRLVVADAATPVAVLFGAVAPQAQPSNSSSRLRVFSVQVAGVPEIHVEEALWLCAEAMDASAPER
jgi:DNA/RNA-binding domain of Phe-tRNA-synthetase-like protein